MDTTVIYKNKTQVVMIWYLLLMFSYWENAIKKNSHDEHWQPPKVSNYNNPGGRQCNSLFWKQQSKCRSSKAAPQIQITFLSYLLSNLNKSWFYFVFLSRSLSVFRQIIYAWLHIPCQKEEQRTATVAATLNRAGVLHFAFSLFVRHTHKQSHTYTSRLGYSTDI